MEANQLHAHKNPHYGNRRHLRRQIGKALWNHKAIMLDAGVGVFEYFAETLGVNHGLLALSPESRKRLFARSATLQSIATQERVSPLRPPPGGHHSGSARPPVR
jgi:hypothetical protein